MAAEQYHGGRDLTELLEGIAHLNLALACGVDLSGIEEVDAMVPCGFHALLDNVSLLLQNRQSRELFGIQLRPYCSSVG